MNKKSKSNLKVLLLQCLVTILLILFLVLIKKIDNSYYIAVKSWLNYQLNNNLILDPENYENLNYLHDNSNVRLIVNLSSPLKEYAVTSNFGKRCDPFNKSINKLHKGVDFSGEMNQFIFSAGSGYVKLAEILSGYGKCVVIDHGNGVQTLYAHCNNIDVYPGDYVIKQQKIATIGTTGNSTGPHVHFEVKIMSKNYDPKLFLEDFHKEIL